MKIGILTFHRADSYGAVLQAHALQQAVRSLGHECDIIDYRNPVIDGVAQVKTIRQAASPKEALKIAVNNTLFGKVRATRHKKFEEFRRQMGLSLPYDRATIPLANDRYDKFITGSDQVFNYNLTGGDHSYLLDFAPAEKRCAYAPSFGITSINDTHLDAYQTVLRDYALLSAREQKGADLVRELTGREDCPVVLDPTMLVENDYWRSITPKNDLGSYVLVFQLNPVPEAVAFAQKLADSRGAKLYIMTQSARNALKGKLGRGSYISDAGPLDFLSLIAGAQCVVTDSFHGTALSICFEKPFFTCVAGGSKVGSRLENILELLGLKDRLLSPATDPEAPIDYVAVKEKERALRARSLEVLRQVETL